MEVNTRPLANVTPRRRAPDLLAATLQESLAECHTYICIELEELNSLSVFYSTHLKSVSVE